MLRLQYEIELEGWRFGVVWSGILSVLLGNATGLGRLHNAHFTFAGREICPDRLLGYIDSVHSSWLHCMEGGYEG